jgi:hypothetical protein
MIRCLIFLTFFWSSWFAVQAQTSFNSDPVIFIEEFSKFMKESKKSEIQKMTDVFSSNWKSGKYTPDQKKFIISISNEIMYKNLARDPYLELMLMNLDYFSQKKFSPNILKQWQEITKALLEKKPKDYLFFLQTANTLFKDNTLVQSNGLRWYSNSSQFEFGFVKNKVSIQFKNLDLICEAGLDKVKIFNASGVFYPDKKNWEGTQGRINFERVGLTESEVYVSFKDYKIDMNTGGFIVDSAQMVYPKISSQPLLGRLTERISQSNSIDLIKTSPFPQFVAYEPSIEIKDIVGTEAKYLGGFSMKGAKINSQNFGDGESSIQLLYKGKPMMTVRSETFRLDSNKVMSQHAAISIVVDTGFITHPNVKFSYDIVKKKVTITRGTDGLMRMPFSDNYHGVEIEVDQVLWDQKQPFIDFDMMTNDKAAYVETNSFFKKFLFDKKQGALAMNPLTKMFQYCRENRLRSFNLEQYANGIGSKKEYLSQLVMDLADDGFIYYNKDNDSIYVKDKLYNWISNSQGTKDYDVIRFQSVIAGRPNITYNMLSHDLKLEGVRRFTFSDSQNVVAVPNEQLVVIKKNKNAQFSGMMRAGRIDFYSKDFFFNYSQFQINNTTMDSMVIYYPDMNSNALRKVNSVLSNTYGRILIDKPNNKSGLKDYAEYPIFIAERGSEINYDRASTHNHAYKADRFKFQVDPFIIDSLDNFTIAGFGFAGTLISDSIFPDIPNTARIQPDYSLGFVDKVKLPMYGGKGTGDLTINLSNRGFYGNGDLIYQTSVSKSPEYLLLPDATTGVSTSFDLPESAKYPLVAGVNIQTQWYPKQDRMIQTRIDSNFSIFKTRYAFDGKMTLSPEDLRGDGHLKWNEAMFTSMDMVFGRNKANAMNSSIKIFAVDPSKFAFESNNVKGDLDFDKREGKFLSNFVGSYTHFPYNQYSSNMNDYKWDMNKKMMEIKPGIAMAGIKPIFVGLPPNQTDSLKFECSFAKFDLVKYVINMEKIPFIDVADSRVYPFAGKAIVREKAMMDRLDSSRIEANKTDKFHDIKNCRTTILGGNSLSATGYYRYIDKYKKEQPLFLDSIRINTDKNLVGYGKISDESNFRLDDKIAFKGLFEVLSIRKPIEFIGYVRPMHSFAYMETLWLRYRNVVDPQNVIIDIANPRDKDNKKLSVGLYFANDSNHVYPIMLDLKRRYSDPELQSDTGILFYDKTKDAFFVGNKEKLQNDALKGNYMQFNEKDKSVYAEGIFDFRVVAPKVRFESAGNAVLAKGDSTYRFNLMTLIDFPFPTEINKAMLKVLSAEGAGVPTTAANTEENIKAIHELNQDERVANKISNSLESSGVITPEGAFNSGFLFTDIDFAFNRIRRKFIAAGPIHLALMNGTVINKKFTTTIALEKRRGSDKIYLYFITDNGDWIYMEYSKGSMLFATSNAELLAAIEVASQKLADEQFVIRIGTERQKENFLKRNDIELDE